MDNLMPERSPALVSVIVPVYNAEEYLADCVDSILAQSYTNWELILVDDGSCDASSALCDAFTGRDARVHAVHQKNAGPGAARNTGIALAKGEYLCFVDSDDRMLPQMLESLVQTMQTACADLVMAEYELLDAPQAMAKWQEHFTCREDYYTAKEFARMCAKVHMRIPICSPFCKLFRSAIIREHDLTFPPDIRYGEDNFFVFSYYAQSARMVVLPEALYQYRITKGSLTTGRRVNRQALETSMRLYRMRMEYFDRFDVQEAHAVCAKALMQDVCRYCETVEAVGLTDCVAAYREIASLPDVERAAIEDTEPTGAGGSRTERYMVWLIRHKQYRSLYCFLRAKTWLKKAMNR